MNPTPALYDPRNGDLSLRALERDVGHGTADWERTNYFTVALVETGTGSAWADAACHSFAGPCLLFFVPYQHVRLTADHRTVAKVVQFHANFLCIETHHHEVGCNGVLFNDPYGVPTVALDEPVCEDVSDLMARIRRELAGGGLAQAELLVSYLKVLLVTATRLKLRQPGTAGGTHAGRRPPLLEALREQIEAHYRSRHAPAAYADLLGVTPKALGRVVRENLGKTLTDLIRERILKHAKWELLHTLRPVKEIARELGYDDELYFSRFFKKATGQSPTVYREFETAIRGGSNLSMPSARPSIPPAAVSPHNGRNMEPPA